MSPLSVAASGLRAGARVAATGATATVTAARLSLLERGGARRRDRARALRDACRRFLALHGVEVEARGAVPPGAAIVVANHVSWLDPLVVASLVPCAPISKLEVGGWPVVGPLARRLGVIFHDRGAPGSGRRVLFEAGAALAAGLPVLNFPEGTTTEGRRVLAFRPGLFALARRAGVPVVPAALRYHPVELAWTGDATFVPHYLRLAAGDAARVELRLGSPISAEAAAGAEALARHVRDAVVGLLEGP